MLHNLIFFLIMSISTAFIPSIKFIKSKQNRVIMKSKNNPIDDAVVYNLKYTVYDKDNIRTESELMEEIRLIVNSTKKI